MFADRALSIYDIKNLSLFDKSIRTLRKRLNELSKDGVVSIRTNSSLYNKTYYNVRELLTPSHNKLVSIIEAQDMIYGDYYSASIINYLRMQATKQEKVIKLSIQEIIDKLQFKASIPTISKRIKELERNNILKATLNGRVYEYEINTELILKTLTPEVVDSLSSILGNILTNYLNIKGIEEASGNKEVFSRMLLSGYDFPTIKQIIAYIGLVKTRYSEIIANATHIRTHYDELAQLSKQVSRRKANRYIYKLLNYFSNPNKKVNVAEVKPNIISDHNLWLDIDEYINQKRGAIVRKFYQFSFGTGFEIGDIIQECKLYLFEKAKRNKDFKKEKIHYLVERIMDIKRKGYQSVDYNFDENIYSSELEDDSDREEVMKFYQKITSLEDSDIVKNLSENFKHIPAKAIRMIVEMLGGSGVRYTYDEFAEKLDINPATLNQYIKPFLDEIQAKTGIKLKGKGYSSTIKQ